MISPDAVLKMVDWAAVNPVSFNEPGLWNERKIERMFGKNGTFICLTQPIQIRPLGGEVGSGPVPGTDAMLSLHFLHHEGTFVICLWTYLIRIFEWEDIASRDVEKIVSQAIGAGFCSDVLSDTLGWLDSAIGDNWFQQELGLIQLREHLIGFMGFVLSKSHIYSLEEDWGYTSGFYATTPCPPSPPSSP